MTNGVSLAAGHPRRWAILWTLLAVECMDLLDSTIVNVAAPTIRRDLHASAAGLEWIVGGYALTYSVGLVTSGRLGDIWGRRNMFLLGAAGFTVASMLCALAPSTGVLIGVRLIQGAFAAVMIPQGFGIIREVFPKEELPKVFGMFGPVIAVGMMLGPILGGLLTQADVFGVGWRLIFFINLPLGIAAFVAGRRLLPESRGADGLTLDIPGALSLALASGLVIYPLIEGPNHGWPVWTFVMMAAGVLLFVAFVWVERRADRPGHTPIIMPSLFSKRTFGIGLLIVVAFFMALTGIFLVMTLYVQTALGFGPVHAGLTYISMTLGTMAGAGGGGQLLVPRIGRKTLHLGLALAALGVIGTMLVLNWTDGAISSWDVALPLFLFGAGSGLVIAPLFSFILSGVDDDEVGSGSGLLNAVQQFGSSVGVAVMVTIFFHGHDLLDGFHRVLWVVLAIIAVLALMVFALPQVGREEDPAAH